MHVIKSTLILAAVLGLASGCTDRQDVRESPTKGHTSSSDYGTGTGAAERACVAAVAKRVGTSPSRLSVLDVKGAQAGIGVTVKVPGATAPYSCLSDKQGNVQGVAFTGDEGRL
jgi:hypothetical protein